VFRGCDKWVEAKGKPHQKAQNAAGFSAAPDVPLNGHLLSPAARFPVGGAFSFILAD
jgi:hypothetical protein